MFKPKGQRAPFEPIVEMMVTEEENGEKSRWEHPAGFTLSWIARDWGFGTLLFEKRDEHPGLYCGDEYMGLDYAKLMLTRFCAATPEAEWPELLRAYGGVEQVMADVVDWESKPREPKQS
jgi:hypothetical protein